MKTSYPTKKLEEVCTIVTDGVHKTPYYTRSGVRFISIANLSAFEPIKWNGYVRYISENDHLEFSKKAPVEKDDILFPRIGTLGFAKRVDFDEAVSIFVGLGLAKPNKKVIDPKFLEFWMNSPFVCRYSFEKATGAGRLTLPLKASREMPVPLPPLEEQKKIVAKLESALEKIKEAKKLRAEALENVENLLSAELHKIFEEGKKKKWVEKELGEVCEVVGGGTPSTSQSEYWGGQYAWVTPKDLGKLKTIEISKTAKTITEEGLKHSSAKLLPVGSVILSSRAPIGYVAINAVEMATNQGCRSFICCEKIHNLYLYYFLDHNTALLQSFGSGSTFSEISGSRLKKIKIPLPSLPEQKKIVARLDSLSEKIKSLQQGQDKQLQDLEELEKSILHQAFAGKFV